VPLHRFHAHSALGSRRMPAGPHWRGGLPSRSRSLPPLHLHAWPLGPSHGDLRSIKGLTPVRLALGVQLADGRPGLDIRSRRTGDCRSNSARQGVARDLHSADPGYSLASRLPTLLLDKETGQIVNNEFLGIIGMFNSASNDIGADPGDFTTPRISGEIDQINSSSRNGEQRRLTAARFATTQEGLRRGDPTPVRPSTC